MPATAVNITPIAIQPIQCRRSWMTNVPDQHLAGHGWNRDDAIDHSAADQRRDKVELRPVDRDHKERCVPDHAVEANRLSGLVLEAACSAAAFTDGIGRRPALDRDSEKIRADNAERE
jgi:hypothetical protein